MTTKLENQNWAIEQGFEISENGSYYVTGEMNFCFGCDSQYGVYVCLVCEEYAGCYYCDFDYSDEHCYSD